MSEHSPRRRVSPAALAAGARAWLEERFELAPLWDFLARKTVPVHRLSWTYLLGGLALFLFLLQGVTGCLLLLYYQPGAETAHASVQSIMHEVPAGWLIRSLHVWGAHFFIFFVLLHLFVGLITRAYRRPRELTWLSGAGALFVSLGLGFTGYLLPWTDLSYYATRVGTGIAGSVPLVGDLMLELMRGGGQVTGHTLSRFFTLHVVVLPGALGLFLLFHLVLIQVQGIGLPLGVKQEQVRDRLPFFSEFALVDFAGWLLLLGVLVTFAVALPAETGVQADPLQPAPEGIKPEWYFLFMFQTLKLVPELLGVALMGLGSLLLCLLPFLDRAASREEASPAFSALFWFLAAYFGVFTLWGWLAPGREGLPEAGPDPAVQAWRWADLALLWLVLGVLVYALRLLFLANQRRRLLRSGGRISIVQ